MPRRKRPAVLAAAYYNGWPADPTAFDNADAIMLYMDGGGAIPSPRGIGWPKSTN